MFLGYCFDENGRHTPGVKLTQPVDAFNYCIHWHHEWHEVRITDLDDYCVMHVVDHVMSIPWPDGSFKYFDMNDPSVLDKMISIIEQEMSDGTK